MIFSVRTLLPVLLLSVFMQSAGAIEQDPAPRAIVEATLSSIKGLLDEPDARERIIGLAVKQLDMIRIVARITDNAFGADEEKLREASLLLKELFSRQYYHQTALLKKRELHIVGERPFGGGGVAVYTEMLGGAEPTRVNYLFHRSEGRWKIYDVLVDDISIVDSYRTQFSRISRLKGDPAAALELLKERVGR